MGKMTTPITLHLLSDSTGNLAQHMLTAFLTQFPSEAFVLRRRTFLATEPQLKAVLPDVINEGGIVFHAMVAPASKKLIESTCKKNKLPSCDLTGSFVDFLSKTSGIKPEPDVKRLHDVSEGYFRRIRALEFTLEHDDGLGLDSIHRADIVLTGVSRTSKTPTSIYLAQQGYRVANVSLAIEVEPPKQLLALTRGVVGLVIDSVQLVEIRKNRHASWNMASTSYDEPDHVKKEVAWSRRIFTDRGWPVLDVTDQAVEETAGRILKALGLGTNGTNL